MAAKAGGRAQEVPGDHRSTDFDLDFAAVATALPLILWIEPSVQLPSLTLERIIVIAGVMLAVDGLAQAKVLNMTGICMPASAVKCPLPFN